jgi:transposase
MNSTKKFIEINRNASFVLPENMDGCLAPEHLARFIVDIVEQLDLCLIEESYSGRGSKAYPPEMMLSLLFYCYSVGLFSSRQIEMATYELIPVIFITGNTHPDHDSINTFRKRFLSDLEELFVEILLIAHGLGILKMGDISLDGTKIHANASKHKAMSWEYANKLEKQFKEEVAQLLEKANNVKQNTKESLNIANEIAHRDVRLEKIKQIKQEIQVRSQSRFEQEKEEYDEKMIERKKKKKNEVEN